MITPTLLTTLFSAIGHIFTEIATSDKSLNSQTNFLPDIQYTQGKFQVFCPDHKCFLHQNIKQPGKENLSAPENSIFSPNHNFNITTHTIGKKFGVLDSSIAFWWKGMKNPTQIFEHNSLKTFCRTPFMSQFLVYHIIYQRIRVTSFSTTTILNGQAFARAQT